MPYDPSERTPQIKARDPFLKRFGVVMEVSKDWLLKYSWAIYVLAALYTFGHCFNHYQGSGPDGLPNVFMTTLGALAAAVGWPLYWTVQLQ